jgi:hypothetical protein
MAQAGQYDPDAAQTKPRAPHPDSAAVHIWTI